MEILQDPYHHHRTTHALNAQVFPKCYIQVYYQQSNQKEIESIRENFMLSHQS